MLVFLLVAAFGLGFFTHQSGWHALPLRLLRDPQAVWTMWRARSALPGVALDVRFGDYQQLAAWRERALRLGVHVPDTDAAVSATAQFGGGAREAIEVRLPGGPALPGETWLLEVRRAGASDWLRVTPLDETRATSAWQQWGYLEALRREGFPAATLTFARLEVNGSAWGLVALETPAPANAYFEAQSLWEALADGEALAAADSFRYADVSGDPAAAALLRAALGGEVPLAEVCNAERLGRFLALTALWTGQPAPDWRALRWSYDPATHLLAPVGAVPPGDAPAPLPAAFFADPTVQIAYARALAEFSAPAYLEQLRREHGPALEAQGLTLGVSPAALWATLVAQQRGLRARLSPEHALAVTLEPDGVGFALWLVNRQAFPVQILGLDAGGAGLRSLDPAWMSDAERAQLVASGDAFVLQGATGALPQPVRIALPRNLTAAGGDTLYVVARFWGVDGPEARIPVQESEIAP